MPLDTLKFVGGKLFQKHVAKPGTFDLQKEKPRQGMTLGQAKAREQAKQFIPPSSEDISALPGAELRAAPEESVFDKIKGAVFEPFVKAFTGMTERERGALPEDTGVRLPFALKKVPIAEPVIKFGISTVSRLLEIVPKAVVQATQNYREAVSLGKADPLKITIDPKRLGFEEPLIISSGERMKIKFDKLQEATAKEWSAWNNTPIGIRSTTPPPKPEEETLFNSLRASFTTVIPDAFDAIVAGSELQLGSQLVLKATGYDPALESAIADFGFAKGQKITLQQFKQRWIEIANRLATQKNPAAFQRFIRSTQRIAQAVTGESARPIGRFAQAMQDMAKRMTREEILRPLVPPTGLPGFAPEPIRRFGFGIQEFKPVGQLSKEQVGAIVNKVVTPEIAKTTAQAITAKVVAEFLRSGVEPSVASRAAQEIAAQVKVPDLPLRPVKVTPTPKPPVVTPPEPTEEIARFEQNKNEFVRSGKPVGEEDIQPLNAALRDIMKDAAKPEIVQHTQNQIKQAIDSGELPVNSEGLIELQRVGKPVKEDRLISASFSKEFIETRYPPEVLKDRPITTFKVKPGDIKVFIGGGEAEVLVDSGVIKPTEAIPKELQPLAQEARKYKSAEEFVDKSGIVPQWGTQNQWYLKNPFRKQLELMKETKKFDQTILKKADRWEMAQVLKEKPAYLNDGHWLSQDEVRKFATQNKLVLGKSEKDGFETLIVAKNKEALDKVLRAKTQRELGLSLGYRDIGVLGDRKVGLAKQQLIDIYNQAIKEVKPPAIDEEKEIALRAAIAKEDIGEVEDDAIADLLAGHRKMRPPSEADRSDWIETLGKGTYLKIFKDDPNLGRADEIADDLGMSSNELLAELDKRATAKQQRKLEQEELPIEIKDWVKSETRSIKREKEFQTIDEDLKKKIKAFYRPARQRTARAFSLLGNKDTTVPLFAEIFDQWTKQGIEVLVEPYAGAYTLGTHSINEAIKGGLKEFHSNIFDKEKYLIVNAIRQGKIQKVKDATKKAVDAFNKAIISYAPSAPIVQTTFNNFFELYPKSYIGSRQWYSWVKEQPIGKEVTVFKDRYEKFRKIFQQAFTQLYKADVKDLDSAVMNALVKRTGVFGGKAQGILNANGFVPFEGKIFGKFGMVAGFDAMDETFTLALQHKTKIFLYNEDGAKMTRRFANASPEKTGFYFDPPYVNSAKTYADQLPKDQINVLEKFTSGKEFYKNHKTAFDLQKKGAHLALTNDVEQEYLETMIENIDNPGVFAYKEGNTPTSLVVSPETKGAVGDFLDRTIKVGATEREEIARIKALKAEKELSNDTVAGVRHAFDVTELKNASPEQLNLIIKTLEDMQFGDSLLTDLQKQGLKRLIEYGKFDVVPDLITKREIREKFGEHKDLLEGRVSKRIATELFPTVDIKEHHPIITRVVDMADDAMRTAIKNTAKKSKEFDKLMFAQEKSETGTKLLSNTKIFQAMGGVAVNLTPEGEAVVSFLKDYFLKTRKDLNLQKWKQYYIPHMEPKLLEKLRIMGLAKAMKSYMNPKDANIPIDIMLALDNIIGSTKFFRFALERKGVMTPTMNIRRIFNEYLRLAETKIALDKVLPEAQAAQQLLLQKKSAIWTKKFLQALKGRGLDHKFRHSEMGWMANVTDRVVDLGYIRLLGGNYWSALKNIVGGETNSFVYQGFRQYILGKERLITHPAKALKFIKHSGALDGSYAEMARSDIITKGKHIADLLLYGGMELGEYEIRGTYLLGQLTDAEWAKVLRGDADVLTNKRFREILNGIAITQGIYTTVDSPLFVKTWYGRIMMQFARWKITNAALVRRIAKGAAEEARKGNYTGKNMRRIIKMLVSYGIMMYMGFELGKRGYKKGKRVALAGAELINNIFSILSGQIVYDAIANNPTIDVLGSFVYTVQSLASYIGVAEEPYPIEIKKTLDDIYIAALRTFGIGKPKEKRGAGVAPAKKKEGTERFPEFTRPGKIKEGRDATFPSFTR